MARKRKMAKSVKGKRRTVPLNKPPAKKSPRLKPQTVTIWMQQPGRGEFSERNFIVRYFLEPKEVEVEEGHNRRTFGYWQKHEKPCPSNAVHHINVFKKEFPDQCPTD